MTNLTYIANIRLPTEKAHGAQIMKTCEALARAGVSVTLVVPRRHNTMTEDPFDYYGVERSFSIRYLPTIDLVRFGRIGFLVQTLTFSLATASYALTYKSDAIFSRDEIPLWLCGLSRAPRIWESHTGAWNYFARRVARRAKTVVTISHGLKRWYVERGVPAQKIVVAPDGVDLAVARPAASENSIRGMLGMSPDEKLVLYAGRLGSWKGTDTLFDAAALLPEHVRVVVIGGEASELFHLKDAHPRISFLGQVPYRDIDAYLAQADALVLPNTATSEISARFTSPLKLFSYMAAGKPIVTSDLSSIREVLGDDACFFVEPDDARELADGIMLALVEPTDATARAARARALVEHYTWDARATAIVHSQQAAVKDTEFYNAESNKYSAKRYPSRATTFTQYFFKERLAQTLSLIAAMPEAVRHETLEVGCADGVVARAIWQRFSHSICTIAAIDISPGMIAAAKRHNDDTSIQFSVREGTALSGRYGLVVEIGVLNYLDVDQELPAVASVLRADGRYLCSIAGNSSLYSRLRGQESYHDWRTYAAYEQQMRRHFTIERIVPVGCFVPLLWRVPAVARLVQPIIDSLARAVLPNAMHEKIYVLKKR